MSTITQLAPYPAAADQVNADNLARHLTAAAFARQPRLFRPEQTAALNQAIASAYVAEYAVAALLRALTAVAPEAADQAARDVWDAWEDGGTCGEQLWEWLTEYGIDPGSVEPYTLPRGADAARAEALAEVERLRVVIDDLTVSNAALLIQRRELRMALDERPAELAEARTERDRYADAWEQTRRALIDQHEAVGHVLALEDCTPCTRMVAEMDDGHACDEYSRWQAIYERALNLNPAATPTAATTPDPQPTRHGYTPHGNRCCPQVTGPRPVMVARCGGVGLCSECREAAAEIHTTP